MAAYEDIEAVAASAHRRPPVHLRLTSSAGSDAEVDQVELLDPVRMIRREASRWADAVDPSTKYVAFVARNEHHSAQAIVRCA